MKPATTDPRIIFICYRRVDSGNRAHRLRESLRANFAEHQLFIDLEIPPGEDVGRYLDEKLSSCAVLLAVIGPEWLETRDEQGMRRLDSDSDLVRLEIATALNNDETTVMPVRVKNASMPRSSDLPDDIAKLAGLNAHELSDGLHWQYDVERLAEAIKKIIIPPERPVGGFAALRAALTAHPYAVAGTASVVAIGLAIILLNLPGDPALRVYSSLPQRQQLQPLNAAGSHDLPVVTNELTRDMQDAMRLALKQAGGQAGKFDVTYEPLDDSDDAGETPAALVQANARRAAKDDKTAVYIGDLTSGATQVSLPILSRAKIPQISMSSTRVGLTRPDGRGDVDEPKRYYPPQPGYSDGYRNFVRIIPRDVVQAKALLALMAQQDGCGRVAMINDNTPYGEALANNILAQNRHRVAFVFSQSAGPRGHYEHLVDRVKAMKVKPGCVVYCGTRNPNTVELFEELHGALPDAKLYGTDGLEAASFFDERKGGISSEVAEAVKVMVPPYDVRQAEIEFFGPFRNAYKREADPNAVYAYEAMKVALKAITDAGNGERADIVRRLFATSRGPGDSVLGQYAVDDAGDTDVTSYGVSSIKDGRLTPPVKAPRLRRR